MKKIGFVSVAIFASLLSGCATNVIDSFIKEQNYDGLYLRGVFSWWEADEKYKLVERSDQVYSTTIELIADGQPYDFKIADATWSPGKNCGYASESDKVIVVGDSVRSSCETTDENFRFTPDETGTFQFTIDFSGFGAPKVSIEIITN
ncbi:hypothetical protein [Paraglaciecola sp. MB-3u-78]|jgi:hypothetical protein|uniref:hypothetical protein n=1 Tax=Paraglaciecola sp. MB-3u-78 TaxID=2058332 RepID=UPI000C3250CE|nr:hypothetical protein [Paraglaciecola sp. MB-3u-78]PKG97908.1 hypothetical protein CXF95_15900 [Paraglaciecola sp. MB-3u-78]